MILIDIAPRTRTRRPGKIMLDKSKNPWYNKGTKKEGESCGRKILGTA